MSPWHSATASAAHIRPRAGAVLADVDMKQPAVFAVKL